MLVSAVPIGLYHRQVLQLSQEKLVDTELVQQADLTRSLAREIQLFEANLTQQLVSERQIMALMGLSDNVEDPVAEPKVTRLLENFAGPTRIPSSRRPCNARLRRRCNRLNFAAIPWRSRPTTGRLS